MSPRRIKTKLKRVKELGMAERKITNLGYLYYEDTFYFEGQKYRIDSIGNKDRNNVCCTNLETRKIKWFDVDTEVEKEQE
jgi:hypothetical protein